MILIRSLLRRLGHCDFLRFGARDRVIRFFHNPDSAPPEEFAVPFFGGLYRGNFNSYIDWNVYYYGAYCREELRLIEDFLQMHTEPVFVDVGANAGNHSLFAALRCDKVISFEPFEAMLKCLRAKQQDNRLANLEICPFGLGDNNSMSPYIPPAASNHGVGSFIAGDNPAGALLLEIRRGDDFFAPKDMGKIHMIKMDIEGFEPRALKGLRETLRKHRPLVFYEWSHASALICDGAPSRDLFPDNYSFHEFISDTVICAVFRRRSYCLKKLNGAWPEGNILAVPFEYAQAVQHNLPESAAARQLARAERF